MVYFEGRFIDLVRDMGHDPKSIDLGEEQWIGLGIFFDLVRDIGHYPKSTDIGEQR